MEDKYIVIIRFDTQDTADGFHKHFNGQRFSSLEVVFSIYMIVMIHRVEYFFSGLVQI